MIKKIIKKVIIDYRRRKLETLIELVKCTLLLLLILIVFNIFMIISTDLILYKTSLVKDLKEFLSINFVCFLAISPFLAVIFLFLNILFHESGHLLLCIILEDRKKIKLLMKKKILNIEFIIRTDIDQGEVHYLSKSKNYWVTIGGPLIDFINFFLMAIILFMNMTIFYYKNFFYWFLLELTIVEIISITRQ